MRRLNGARVGAVVLATGVAGAIVAGTSAPALAANRRLSSAGSKASSPLPAPRGRRKLRAAATHRTRI